MIILITWKQSAYTTTTTTTATKTQRDKSEMGENTLSQTSKIRVLGTHTEFLLIGKEKTKPKLKYSERYELELHRKWSSNGQWTNVLKEGLLPSR